MYHLLSVLFVLFVVGCAGTPRVSDEALNSKYAGQMPSEALRVVDKKVIAAKEARLGYYSPINFKDAQDALEEAKVLAKEKPNNREILQYVFVAEQHLDNANRVAASVKQELTDIFNQQKILEVNHVTDSYNEDFEDLLSDTRDIIDDIEKIKRDKPEGKNEFVAIKKDKSTLLNRMVALNVLVVKHNALAVSKKELEKAKKADAKKLAPLTFKAMLDALQLANQFIEANVSDKTGVAQVAEAFRFAVQHLIQVTDAVIVLSKTNKKDYEKFVLAQEQKLLLISKALNYKDLRDLPAEEQASVLAAQAGHVSQRLAQKNQEYAELTQQSIALKDKVDQEKQSSEESSKQLSNNVSALNTKITALEQERALLKGQINQLQQKVVQLAIEKSTLMASDSSARREAFKMHDLPAQSDKEQAFVTTPTAVDIKLQANEVAIDVNKSGKKNIVGIVQQDK